MRAEAAAKACRRRRSARRRGASPPASQDAGHRACAKPWPAAMTEIDGAARRSGRNSRWRPRASLRAVGAGHASRPTRSSSCLREAMHQAIGEPRLTLRAAPEVVEALKRAHRPRSPMKKVSTAACMLAADPGDRQCRLPHRMARRRRRTQPRRRIEAALDSADRAAFLADTAPVQLHEKDRAMAGNDNVDLPDLAHEAAAPTPTPC